MAKAKKAQAEKEKSGWTIFIRTASQNRKAPKEAYHSEDGDSISSQPDDRPDTQNFVFPVFSLFKLCIMNILFARKVR